MAYTEPKVWTNEPLVSTDMNTYVSDNLTALKEPPSAHYELDEGSNFQTTSTSFTNVDGTDTDGLLRHTITTTGGDIMVWFNGMVAINTDTTGVFLNVSLDNVDVTTNDGITGFYRFTSGVNGSRFPISFFYMITGVSAGSHTLRLRWKVVGSATATLYAGAGTTGGDIHSQFGVREMS